MARPLSKFPQGPGPTPLYPYSEWLDGQPWLLMTGEDYACSTRTMLTSIRVQAKKRGGRVRTRRVSDQGREALAIQFLSGVGQIA